MNDFLPRLLRNVCFAVIALIGAAMAIVFMVSTAIAVGLLYIVARLRGKPFGVRAYWQQRRGPMNPFNAPVQPYAKAATDVIDVQAREIH
ncbi:MAG TPA: hypothetical protein VF445_03575 [Bordetella sp.]|uniref:hypothetical protein n=1 Tax=Bordetella sp. TaxID=28081 RepID=UPI002ED20F63